MVGLGDAAVHRLDVKREWIEFEGIGEGALSEFGWTGALPALRGCWGWRHGVCDWF